MVRLGLSARPRRSSRRRARGRDVVDLGAGTGKFTRLLVPTGARLTAVEPLGAMREQFARAVPGVPILDGNATSLPLPDASVDAVTVRYLIWKIREAEEGRINVGPRKTRARWRAVST